MPDPISVSVIVPSVLAAFGFGSSKAPITAEQRREFAKIAPSGFAALGAGSIQLAEFRARRPAVAPEVTQPSPKLTQVARAPFVPGQTAALSIVNQSVALPGLESRLPGLKEVLKKAIPEIIRRLPRRVPQREKAPARPKDPKVEQKGRDTREGKMKKEPPFIRKRRQEEIMRQQMERQPGTRQTPGRIRTIPIPTDLPETQVEPMPEIRTTPQMKPQVRPRVRPRVSPALIVSLILAGVTVAVAAAGGLRSGRARGRARLPTRVPPATPPPPSPGLGIATGTLTSTAIGTRLSLDQLQAGGLSSQLRDRLQRQQRERRCEKRRRKNRKTCWKGFYSERRNRTIFKKWFKVDCVTGRQLRGQQ